jgi:Transposase, Mutator family
MSRADRRRALRAQRRADHLAQRSPRPHARHPARRAAAAHPEIAARQLFPAVPGSPQELGEGADRGDPGGLDRRRLDPAGRRSGAGNGAVGISKSQVSKLCKEIDERVHAFLDRPLAGEWPYLWLDATYLKQREGGRIVSVAAIIAVAANIDGRREIVGLHIGPSEAETFWSSFLKSLTRRGLRGVKAGDLRCP